jgi:hypothetical protein
MKAYNADYDRLAAFEASDKVRRATLPPAPTDYKAELPPDFKVPDGVTFQFNANDPLLVQAQTVAHQAGLSQEQFSKLLGIYAGGQVSSAQQIQTARNAEVQKLGATGPARIDALTTFFRAYLGDADGNAVMARAFTAADVQRLEKLVGKITSQGGAQFRGSGRIPPEQAGRVSDEQFARMNDRDRLDYTRQFKQSEMPPWRDPRG